MPALPTEASKTLNFLKRNLNKCSEQVKESAYLTMVRPQLEYASDVWDPHQTGDIVELEKIQRRAARWVMNDYGRLSYLFIYYLLLLISKTHWVNR